MPVEYDILMLKPKDSFLRAFTWVNEEVETTSADWREVPVWYNIEILKLKDSLVRVFTWVGDGGRTHNIVIHSHALCH